MDHDQNSKRHQVEKKLIKSCQSCHLSFNCQNFFLGISVGFLFKINWQHVYLNFIAIHKKIAFFLCQAVYPTIQGVPLVSVFTSIDGVRYCNFFKEKNRNYTYVRTVIFQSVIITYIFDFPTLTKKKLPQKISSGCWISYRFLKCIEVIIWTHT